MVANETGIQGKGPHQRRSSERLISKISLPMVHLYFMVYEFVRTNVMFMYQR